ncbi:MAG TPA: ATP-binding protein [Actinomycetales bacterium]|nr:ATP-binding protein [Actinomycetales bacterium]
MAATISPLAPPLGEAPRARYRPVRRWVVRGAAGIGPVRRAVTQLLASGCGEEAAGGVRPVGLADVRNRVALICSELVTNAVRHGDPPVAVELLTDGASWLLDVTDGATDRLPDADVVRPLGHGGYGLMLVARLSSHVGWYVEGGRKHVWSRIDLGDGNSLMEQMAGDVSSLTEGRDEVPPP